MQWGWSTARATLFWIPLCESYAGAVILASLHIFRAELSGFGKVSSSTSIFLHWLQVPLKARETFHFTFCWSRLDCSCLVLWDAERLFSIVQILLNICQKVFSTLARLSQHASLTPLNKLLVQVTVHCTSGWTKAPVFSALHGGDQLFKNSDRVKGHNSLQLVND